MQRAPGRHAAWLATWCALAVLNASCAIRLAADYDEQIDRAATSLQQEMDAHLTKLELLGTKPSAAFANHEQFYADYGVKLRSVRVRALGHAKNDITVQQLDNMAKSLIALRDQHERGGTLSAAFINTTRELFNTGWAAVIKWEIAKKRGG
jgi:6-phosphofructokinase